MTVKQTPTARRLAAEHRNTPADAWPVSRELAAYREGLQGIACQEDHESQKLKTARAVGRQTRSPLAKHLQGSVTNQHRPMTTHTFTADLAAPTTEEGAWRALCAYALNPSAPAWEDGSPDFCRLVDALFTAAYAANSLDDTRYGVWRRAYGANYPARPARGVSDLLSTTIYSVLGAERGGRLAEALYSQGSEGPGQCARIVRDIMQGEASDAEQNAWMHGYNSAKQGLTKRAGWKTFRASHPALPLETSATLKGYLTGYNARLDDAAWEAKTKGYGVPGSY